MAWKVARGAGLHGSESAPGKLPKVVELFLRGSRDMDCPQEGGGIFTYTVKADKSYEEKGKLRSHAKRETSFSDSLHPKKGTTRSRCLAHI